MTDKTELKRLAEEVISAAELYAADSCNDYLAASWATADEVFRGGASPTAVLNLLSENERVKARLCVCRDCGGQGEVYSGRSTYQGHNQPPEPEMDVCGTCGGDGVLGPVEDFEALAAEGDQLKAENEALRKDRTDWQAECLKRGFKYVREPDDHYVLADVPEMADLLGALLGVEVRNKENDSYEEANSRLNEQIEGLTNTVHSLESLRKDAERYRGVRRVANRQGFTDEQFDQQTDARTAKFDSAMGKGEQS